MLGLIPSTKYKLTYNKKCDKVGILYVPKYFFSLWYESTILCSSSSNVYEDLFMLLLWLRYRSAEITLNVLYVLMNHDIAFFNNIINGFKKCLWLSSRSTTPKIGMNFASI